MDSLHQVCRVRRCHPESHGDKHSLWRGVMDGWSARGVIQLTMAIICRTSRRLRWQGYCHDDAGAKAHNAQRQRTAITARRLFDELRAIGNAHYRQFVNHVGATSPSNFHKRKEHIPLSVESLSIAARTKYMHNSRGNIIQLAVEKVKREQHVEAEDDSDN